MNTFPQVILTIRHLTLINAITIVFLEASNSISIPN